MVDMSFSFAKVAENVLMRLIRATRFGTILTNLSRIMKLVGMRRNRNFYAGSASSNVVALIRIGSIRIGDFLYNNIQKEEEDRMSDATEIIHHWLVVEDKSPDMILLDPRLAKIRSEQN